VTVGTGNGGVITSVVMGESSHGIVIDFMANNSRRDGNPINFVYPESGSIIITEPVGILRTTQNPEAAQLFVDFLLSRAGQELKSQMGYVPLHRDVPPPEGLRSINEIRRLAFDVSVLYTERESDQVRFSALFG
jgi:iron(III) transport system substrate-binding protein